MSAHEQALNRLGALRASDRAWILKRMSVRERAALMEAGMQSELHAFDARGTASSSVSAPLAAVNKEDRAALLLASAAKMTEVLRREPPWLIAAVLALDEWSWASVVLQSLTGHVRAEVQHLLVKPLKLTPAMRDAVLASCAQQIGTSSMVARHSRIKALLKSMEAALVRKRRTLRL